MNEVLITFLISFALSFIILMQIVNLAKITRIERKYVKQVEVIRYETEIDKTIKQFEARGWLLKNIKPYKPFNNYWFVITFIK